MTFRNTLLIFSLTLLAFCLSLYFQSAQELNHVNHDPHYKHLDFSEESSHSLAEFNEKIAPTELEDVILEVYEKNRLAGEKTRVMEIGPGNGRVLMELTKKYPEIEFYGITKDKTHTFYRRESFLPTALKFEIFTKDELEDVALPYLVFQDLDFGARIPYEENKFDIIFSQNVIPHIKYKFELFNEIMRVLKPGGRSYHTDVPQINVYDKGVVLEMRDALAEMRKRGFEIMLLDNPRTIRFKKKESSTLFPVTPHQPIPENLDQIPSELRKPEMGYNLRYDI